jgi:23S rRNA pseudouridine955/2504/2580 synthase
MKTPNFKDLIIHESDDYILVNKPPYLSTLEDRSSNLNLQLLAKEYCPTAQIGHRLDKETSGVLAIAKNPEAYRNIAIQFEKRTVTKVYHAVIGGLQSFEEYVINAPILTMTKGYVKVDFREGKQAKTTFNTLEVYKRHTLIECLPTTGRMHQIRIHLSHSHFPIVADLDYHGEDIYLSELKKNFSLKKHTEEEPLIKRVALHAYRLEFEGLSGEKIQGIAEYPKDFGALIKQLRKFSNKK